MGCAVPEGFWDAGEAFKKSAFLLGMGLRGFCHSARTVSSLLQETSTLGGRGDLRFLPPRPPNNPFPPSTPRGIAPGTPCGQKSPVEDSRSDLEKVAGLS